MGDDRGSVYMEGDRAIYRASAIGACLKELWAYRMGSFTPLAVPDAMQARFDDGHLHEGAVLEVLADRHGWALQDASQDEIEMDVSSQVAIRGHVDGVGVGDCKRVIEIKALAQSTFDEWRAKRWESTLGVKYAKQLTVYMAALGLPALFVVKNKNSGALDILHVDEAPADLVAIQAHVLQVEGYARRGDTPPCETPSWICPFRYLHEGPRDADEVGADQAAEIEALATSYDEARARADEADKVKKETRGLLLTAMGEAAKVESGGWRVHNITSRRRVLDKAKVNEVLGAQNLSLADFETETTSTQLRVERTEEPA